MFLSSWEMHKTDLFRTPHWAKVIVRSVKVLRGTSIVSTIQLSNLSPNSASAADSTAWSWSVGRKWHLNLWPHGVLIASSRHGSSGGVRPVWLPGVTSGVTIVWTREVCWHILRLLSPWPNVRSVPVFFSMEGRTLYLLRETGPSGGLSKISVSISVLGWLQRLRMARDRRHWFSLSFALVAGGWGERDEDWEGGVIMGLLRPLDDLGLLTCILPAEDIELCWERERDWWMDGWREGWMDGWRERER